MTESFPETQADAIARTTLTDRELLIHAVQHLEVQGELITEMHGTIMALEEELAMFRPLLAKLAPGGKPDMIGIMQTRREARRGR